MSLIDVLGPTSEES